MDARGYENVGPGDRASGGGFRSSPQGTPPERAASCEGHASRTKGRRCGNGGLGGLRLPRLTPCVAVVLSLATVLASSTEARAQSAPPQSPYSMFGGKLLDGGQSAIGAGFGWPGLFFEYDIGVSSAFNLGFRGDLYFGNPFGGFDVGLGFGFAVPMRIRIAQLQRVDLALKLAPRFFAGQLDVNQADLRDKAFVVGIGFEPGLLVGVRVHEKVNVIAGVSFPVLFAIDTDHEQTEVWFPIAAFGGAELALSDEFNLFGTLGVGPSIHAGGRRTKAEAYFGLYLGFEYAL